MTSEWVIPANYDFKFWAILYIIPIVNGNYVYTLISYEKNIFRPFLSICFFFI